MKVSVLNPYYKILMMAVVVFTVIADVSLNVYADDVTTRNSTEPIIRGRGPWVYAQTPTYSTPQAIGFHGAGCLEGAKSLEPSGIGYQAMRLSRRRHYGHPSMISFIEKLGELAHEKQVGTILVGDITHPRGGPMPGSHFTHQTGLDVDIWYWLPQDAKFRNLTPQERETLSSPNIIKGEEYKNGIVTRNGVLDRDVWTDNQVRLLALVAAFKQVHSIYVDPLVKWEMCRKSEFKKKFPGFKNRWLRKFRPARGHRDHFHVMLNCPKEDKACVGYAELPKGTGCGPELESWFIGKDPLDELEQKSIHLQFPTACQDVINKP